MTWYIVGMALVVGVYVWTCWYDARNRRRADRRIAELENDLEVYKRLADGFRERSEEGREDDDTCERSA